MRKRFANLSIGRKVTILTTSIVLVAVLVTTAVSSVHQVNEFRRIQKNQAAIVASLVAADTAPALLFELPREATEILQRFSSIPELESIELYTATEGSPSFAYYGETLGRPTDMKPEDARFRDGMYELTTPILHDGRDLGSAYIVYNLKRYHEQIRRTIIVSILTGSLCTLLALLLAHRMKRWVLADLNPLSHP